VRAIPLAVDHDVFRPSDNVAREAYLLYPARPWRHKNHARLFEAFARLRTIRPELRLVLTGEGDFGVLPPGVEALGRISRDELVRLYQGAAALVFPSLYEGFGMPVLEAMACGCPVACSNVTSLPEVAGDAARTFDPRNIDDIAAAIESVLADPQPWIERGLERARSFTWDACARAHDAVYRELSSR
jgi:glycosyltransferase involved in cell wall biosynthesis